MLKSARCVVGKDFSCSTLPCCKMSVVSCVAYLHSHSAIPNLFEVPGPVNPAKSVASILGSVYHSLLR